MTKNIFHFLAPGPGAAGGQVMILTVLTLGGTILAATTVAGLLLTYQIRQSTDFANSAKAVFAADAGIERGLYEFYNSSSALPQSPLSNGASFAVTCSDSLGNFVACNSSSSALIKSVGSAGNARRAFSQSLVSPVGPPPASVYHYACDSSNSCVQVEGEGTDYCAHDIDCVPNHLACVDNGCQTVEGEGSDSCSSDLDCQ